MRSLASTVLQTALQQALEWRQAGLDISVAVNLSVANLIDTHLPVEVGNVLAGFGLPASALELEITETTLMVDPVRSGEVLGALRTLGVRIAVDDYGTGYSSLAYLQQLAVDELKLDNPSSCQCCRTQEQRRSCGPPSTWRTRSAWAWSPMESRPTPTCASWPGSAATSPRATTSAGHYRPTT
jgi:EAL domain-containing protein (putative c-di-GMP-specific phosphodiesterase class I)